VAFNAAFKGLITDQEGVCLSLRPTELYRYCILIFVQFCYMFRLYISVIITREYWFTKTVKSGRGLSLQTVGLRIL